MSEEVKKGINKRNLNKGILTVELWREYIWNSCEEPYRINNPVAVYWRDGGTTHRVVDEKGVAHCIPAPGHMGCVLRWKVKDGQEPVAW